MVIKIKKEICKLKEWKKNNITNCHKPSHLNLLALTLGLLMVGMVNVKSLVTSRNEISLFICSIISEYGVILLGHFALLRSLKRICKDSNHMLSLLVVNDILEWLYMQWSLLEVRRNYWPKSCRIPAKIVNFRCNQNTSDKIYCLC